MFARPAVNTAMSVKTLQANVYRARPLSIWIPLQNVSAPRDVMLIRQPHVWLAIQIATSVLIRLVNAQAALPVTTYSRRTFPANLHVPPTSIEPKTTPVKIVQRTAIYALLLAVKHARLAMILCQT